MKKIILILLFLMVAGIGKTQTLDTAIWTPVKDAQGFNTNMVTNKVTWYGVPAYGVKIPLQMALTYVAISSLPVVRTENTDTLRTEVLSFNGQTYVNIRNSWDWSRFSRSFRDTSATLVDTLSRRIDPGDTCNSLSNLGMTEFWQCVFATDDTIEVSTSTSFPAYSSWFIYPSESWTSERFSHTYFTNLYWRRSGTGTATVRVRMWSF